MEFFQSVELHPGGSLELAGYSVTALGGENAWLLLRSSSTELCESVECCVGWDRVFNLVELYLDDGLEMVDCLVVTLEGKKLHGHC